MGTPSKEAVLSLIESAWNQIRDESDANVIRQFGPENLSLANLSNFFSQLAEAIDQNPAATPAFASRVIEYANSMDFSLKVRNMASYSVKIRAGIIAGSRGDEVKEHAMEVVDAFHALIEELQTDPSLCPDRLEAMEQQFGDLTDCIGEFLSGSAPHSNETLKNYSQVAEVTFGELRYAIRYQKQLYVLAEHLSAYRSPERDRFIKKRPTFSLMWSEVPTEVPAEPFPDEDLAEIAGPELDTFREILRPYVMIQTREEEIAQLRRSLKQCPRDPARMKGLRDDQERLRDEFAKRCEERDGLRRQSG
jgi:hypothetical protein